MGISYTWCPETFRALGFVISDEPPPNSTEWPPPKPRDGQEVYFNGHAWMYSRPLDQFTPAVLIKATLDAPRREMRNAIRALTAGVSPEEVATYSRQEADAREYLRTGVPSAFLETLSASRGVDLKVLAPKIINKAEAYHKAVAAALGAYQKKADEIEKNPPVLTQELLRSPHLFIPG